MTSKGQVTIPKEIRQVLDVKPGDQVEFQVAPNRQVIVRLSSPPSCFSRDAGDLARQAGLDPDRIVSELRGEES
jgi:AbrB family looped-hinge helix DNA binding protein